MNREYGVEKPHLTFGYRQLVKVFVLYWVLVFTLRFLLNTLFQSELYFSAVTLFSILFLLFCSFPKLNLYFFKLCLIDQVLLVLGFVFCGYGIIIFDYIFFQTSFIIFIVPILLFLLVLGRDVRKIVVRGYLFLGIMVSLEIIFEFIFFNHYFLGLGEDFLTTYDYLEYRSLFSHNESYADDRAVGGILRVDGLFGYNHTTGAFLAVLAAFFFEYVKYAARYRIFYALYFFLFLLGVFASTSTTAILALALSLFFSVFLDVGVKRLTKGGLFFFVVVFFVAFYFSSLGGFLFDRLNQNLESTSYVSAFIPAFQDFSHFLRYLAGFNSAHSFIAESDLFRIISNFGIIVVFILFYRVSRLYLCVFRSNCYANGVLIYRASGSAVLAGFLVLIHTSATLGWNVGSAVFLFYSLLMVHFYQNRVGNGADV
ncbi:hypothetical protein DN730_10435 [Marinomonas piezotolerans]|uniref:Uncharacterized protein n=1 Tax=Marinomonas piezotolerans TaxID=2213058 RepID=A0A370U8F8_9GAMM|nr:hypothetical protein [Marinomonas piezotolerans]RDL44045.1 hypothetical protein DN730_10435 [Marinomonas piezotolerans]